MQNCWVRIAAEIEKTEEPTIVDLVRFVKDEAEIVKLSYPRFVAQKPKGFRKFATHATGVEEKLIKTKRYYLCFRNHYLWDCFEFFRTPLDQRIAFLRQNKLCGFCFRQGHIARFCQNDDLCAVEGCQRKHHPLLHRDWKPPHAKENQSRASTSNPSTVGMTSNISKESISNQVFLNVVLYGFIPKNPLSSDLNPADDATRGLAASKRIIQDHHELLDTLECLILGR